MLLTKLTDWLRRQSTSVAGRLVSYDSSKGILYFVTDRKLELSRRIRLNLPQGETAEGHVLWQRSLENRVLPLLTALSWTPKTSKKNSFENIPSKYLRQFVRHPVRLWVVISEANHLGCVTLDLSVGGCQIEGDWRTFLGSILNLRLELSPSEEPIVVNARVAWAQTQVAGLQFLNVPVFSERRLLRLLGECLLRSKATDVSYLIEREPEHCFEVEASTESLKLSLMLTNWKVEYEFRSAKFRGPAQGKFQIADVPQTSLELLALKSELGLSLSRERKLVHLRLLDNEWQTVAEVYGEEVSFVRSPLSGSPVSSDQETEILAQALASAATIESTRT